MDFLSTRSESAIRKEICGIRDSYHHYWDLLAELLQNSRDAINRRRSLGCKGPFFISMEIDSSSNTVTVMDNGVGIPENKIHEMLAPGGGDKDGRGTEVGEKGVGLTYAVFSGNNFSIESRVIGFGSVGGKVVSAQSWLDAHAGVVRPEFTPADKLEERGGFVQFKSGEEGAPLATYSIESYTRISVGSITPSDSDVSIFALTAQQLRVLIQSRTAVGVSEHLTNDGKASEFNFYLKLKLPSGETFEKIEASYIKPHEMVSPKDRVELEAVRDAFVIKNDGAAKRKFLGSRTVYATHQTDVDGWKINVYGVMFPDNGSFRQLSCSVLGLIADEDEDSEGAALFQSGIFVGTKGMPTGMRIEPKSGGRYPAYYRRCFFFVESPNLKFDLGRKSLHYKYTKRLQTAVAELFGRFEDIAPFQGDSRTVPTEARKSQMERRRELQEEWSSARNLADLNVHEIPYSKIPNNQEAAVAAVFHELLGARVLTGYRVLKTGYGARYDAHASCTGSDGSSFEAVIEFKHDLHALIKDLQEEKKNFSEINLLVAWDADEQKLKDAGFDLEAVSEAFFNGVTHMITVPVPGIDPIEVILLRTFLDRRKSKK
ncbi:hypothetical protein GV729_09425 [Pseudomonas sp. Fl4BN2]|nr:hypothetical protein [Pseudomonas sp. Fl4BN2]